VRAKALGSAFCHLITPGLAMMKLMLTYQPATPEQIDEFLHLMQLEAADYLDRTMSLMDLTWSQFVHLAQTVGQVFSIYHDDELVGFYWTEERDRTVHLHGLVIRSAYQNQGIGTEVLAMLAHKYAGVMDAIELGVHESNVRARALYGRVGYQTIKHLADLGFCILQRPLSEKDTVGT
jgi:ribosomal protein S18 acetylase RimI-like enzyme